MRTTVVLGLVLATASCAGSYDVVIRGGTVIDGTTGALPGVVIRRGHG